MKGRFQGQVMPMRRRWLWLLAFFVVIASVAVLVVNSKRPTLPIERTVVAQVPPDFADWLATDLDGDGKAEVLLSYFNRPSLLLRLPTSPTSPASLIPLPKVLLIFPSTTEIRKASLPLAKAVPIWDGRILRLMRWRNNRFVFEPLTDIPINPQWHDEDGDGKANDLIVYGSQKRFWFVLDGQGEWRFKTVLPNEPNRPLLDVGDIDGDGKLDYLVGGETRSILWGDGRSATVLGKTYSEVNHLRLTDMDGDGRKEVVGFKREGHNYRMAIWTFDRQRKRLSLVALSEPFPIRLSFRTNIGGDTVQGSLQCFNFLPIDLDGDGRKEIVAIWNATNFQVVAFKRPVPAFLALLQPPFPELKSELPQVWRLFWRDGQRLRSQPLRMPKDWKGFLLTRTPLNLQGQRFLVTTCQVFRHRFHPHLLSLRPLRWSLWESASVWRSAIWRLPDGKDAFNPEKWTKVAELSGRPLIADLNGDGQPEIFGNGMEEWHSRWHGQRCRINLRFGIALFDGKQWRQFEWHPQKSQLPAHIQQPLMGLLPTQSRFLLLPEGDRKVLLLALPDGTIEQVAMR
jgi:hypothetical protein